jgi:hypothetical protein
MEVPQGNSLCIYLKQTKSHFFSFTKSENRAEQVLPGDEWDGGLDMGKWCGSVNIMQILHTRICKWRNEPS